MGGLMAPVLPGGTAGTWALLEMAATLAGVTRSPLTAIVFAFELTHDTGSMLPLLVACAAAHLLSTTVLKRSILTEKVARRGFHVAREYQVEPLDALFVREAMLTDLVTATTEIDLLKARHRELIEERQRERVLRLRRPTPLGATALALAGRTIDPEDEADDLAGTTSRP
jgi:hypothetical protein